MKFESGVIFRIFSGNIFWLHGPLQNFFHCSVIKIFGKIAVYDSSARFVRSAKEPKQTQNTNPKYEQTQNTKGFHLPRLQGVIYCNSAKFSIWILRAASYFAFSVNFFGISFTNAKHAYGFFWEIETLKLVSRDASNFTNYE